MDPLRLHAIPCPEAEAVVAKIEVGQRRRIQRLSGPKATQFLTQLLGWPKTKTFTAGLPTTCNTFEA